MLSLIIIVGLSLLISFSCSIMEAAFLTVPYAHVKSVAESGSRAGKILLSFKDDVRKPIAAILLLNTVSHTVGAAVGAISGVAVITISSALAPVYTLPPFERCCAGFVGAGC